MCASLAQTFFSQQSLIFEVITKTLHMMNNKKKYICVSDVKRPKTFCLGWLFGIPNEFSPFRSKGCSNSLLCWKNRWKQNVNEKKKKKFFCRIVRRNQMKKVFSNKCAIQSTTKDNSCSQLRSLYVLLWLHIEILMNEIKKKNVSISPLKLLADIRNFSIQNVSTWFHRLTKFVLSTFQASETIQVQMENSFIENIFSDT